MILLFSHCQDLEHNLADVMRQSFKQCWDTRAKLRLLEVFEGISGRELVQVRIKQSIRKNITVNVYSLANVKMVVSVICLILFVLCCLNDRHHMKSSSLNKEQRSNY